MLGPILGGVLGAHWVRLTFLAAAALNAANFLFVALVVPESRKGSKDAMVPKLSLRGPVKPLMELRFMWGLIFVAVTGQGWMAFMLMPLCALGGTGLPILHPCCRGGWTASGKAR